MTGVEGYVESAASGIIAGINAARLFEKKSLKNFPIETCHGALANYITSPTKNFQPMNINFGLMPPFDEKVKRRDKKSKLSERALTAIKNFSEEI